MPSDIEKVTIIFKAKSKFKKHKDTYERIWFESSLDTVLYSAWI